MPSPFTVTFPIILRPSRRRLAGRLAVSLLLVGLGIWLIPRHPLIGVANIIFFGACAVVFLIQCHPHSSTLVIDREGFTFSSLFRAHTVRWDEVADFQVIAIGPNRFVGWISPTMPTAHHNLAAINQAIFGIHACLPDNFGLAPEALAALLTACRSAALTQPKTPSNVPDISLRGGP